MCYLLLNHFAGLMKPSITCIHQSTTHSQDFLIQECLSVRPLRQVLSTLIFLQSLIVFLPFRFKGYASDLYEILKTPIKNTDDDQLYYTRAFLDKDLRNKLKFKLDYKSDIFQNLHGTIGMTAVDVKSYS